VNKLLEEPDLYDPVAFEDVKMVSTELRDLRDAGVEELEGLELARFNRLLMEAAFPEMVRSSPPTSIQLTYTWADFGFSYPLRGETLRESLQTTSAIAVNWIVGVIGVLESAKYLFPGTSIKGV
jgi:hypothetical protein